jgi:hypothetical protein
MDSQGALYASNGKDSILVSNDGGSTWQFTYSIPIEGNSLRGFRCDDQDRLIVETYAGLYTGNKGKSTLDTTFLMGSGNWPAFRIEEIKNGYLAVTTPGGEVYRTNDDGTEWDLSYRFSHFDWNPPYDNHIVARNGNILRFNEGRMKQSTDNGLTWLPYSTNDTLPILSVIDDSRGVLFAQTGRAPYGIYESHSVVYSTNEGIDWIPITTADSVMNLAGIDDADNVFVRAQG